MPVNTQDEIFLRHAISLAHQARQAGERPFGAILVFEGKVIAEAQDQCRILNDPIAHAEIRLISSYCQESGQFDLSGTTIYTCAEPCLMCSGAIKWAGISRVVFSVSQAMLQKVSGGRIKPTCDELVNTGGRHIDVYGLHLVEEGLPVLRTLIFHCTDRNYSKIKNENFVMLIPHKSSKAIAAKQSVHLSCVRQNRECRTLQSYK